MGAPCCKEDSWGEEQQAVGRTLGWRGIRWQGEFSDEEHQAVGRTLRIGGLMLQGRLLGGEHQAVGRTPDEKQHLRPVTGFASPGPVNLR